MKKLVLALTAVAAFAAPALAADLAPRPYVKAAPVVYTPTWTGCYVGGGGGYGMWNQENVGFFQDGANSTRRQFTETATAGGRGYLATVQGGCDYQFGVGTYNFVVGAFGDYDWTSMKGKLNLPGTDLYGNEKMSSAWSVGGRIGWLVTPQLLTYFSAGYTEATFDQTNFHVNFANPPVDVAAIGKQTYKGYFIGAGDEYALSFLPGLFWKTEYRFSALDNERVGLRNLQFPTNFIGTTYESQKWTHTVRSELVYRFNWGGPVVAKY
jgi:outer membrane immunogenic protein